MSRSKDEKIRIAHALDHMRWVLESVQIALRLDAPMGADLAQTIETAANNLARGMAKHDAFLLAEQDMTRSTER